MPLSEKVGQQRVRILCLSLLVIALLLLLAGRLFYLQIMQGHTYAEQALKNMVRPERIPAQRGRIYDREGRLLAGSRVGFNLNLEAGHPAYRDQRRLRGAVEEVAAILGRDADVLEQRALRYRRMFEPLLIARDMQISALAPFFERLYPIQGITRSSIPVRWYPNGDLAAHVLGHVGVIEEEELEKAGDLRFRRGVFLGRSGIEFQYETMLHGTDGETSVEVDAVGRTTDLFSDLPPKPAKPGSDLYLTLDARLQRVAEDALRKAQPHGEEGSAPVRGSLVALDPWTGEVLVCASSPGFDPNDFAHGLTPAQWKALNDETHPLLNRVIQAAYPPGSTFKVVTALAGLDEGIVSGEM
ncbi:MAG: penicillin-binding protein 2, partial [Candidatus Eisenbacteria sp.]|nr:penicillin-binding protein 2 [Candidatus Eisenbacteria bacterium]